MTPWPALSCAAPTGRMLARRPRRLGRNADPPERPQPGPEPDQPPALVRPSAQPAASPPRSRTGWVLLPQSCWDRSSLPTVSGRARGTRAARDGIRWLVTDIATDRARLLEIIRDKAIVHGRVTLSSGKEADYYVDLRRITLDGEAAPARRPGDARPRRRPRLRRGRGPDARRRPGRHLDAPRARRPGGGSTPSSCARPARRTGSSSASRDRRSRAGASSSSRTRRRRAPPARRRQGRPGCRGHRRRCRDHRGPCHGCRRGVRRGRPRLPARLRARGPRPRLTATPRIGGRPPVEHGSTS